MLDRAEFFRGDPFLRFRNNFTGNALADLLRVTVTELPAHLDEIGQELAFHLATDPSLYDRLESALRQRRPVSSALLRGSAARARRAPLSPDIRATRAKLRARDASPALKARLGG